jgi:hypothetical protein
MTTDPIYAASPISTVDFSLGGLLPGQDAHYVRRTPCAPACRRYAAIIQPYRNSPQRVAPAAQNPQALLRRSLRWPRCPAARIDFSLSPSAGDLHRASHKISQATT